MVSTAEWEEINNQFELARSANQDLHFEKISDVFRRMKLPFEPEQRKMLKLITSGDTYTNLAWLLSDECTTSIKLALFDGETKLVYQDRMEVTGSLLKQAEEAYSYLEKHNRPDRSDYPEEALRESLLNLLIHRDYSVPAASFISIFEGRIEFLSYGGLAMGLTIEDINLGISLSRNPSLAAVFYHLELVDAYGIGLRRIRLAYRENKQKPLIEVTPDSFKLTLPNRNVFLS